jgi:inositol-5-monophosphate dehydrogenase
MKDIHKFENKQVRSHWDAEQEKWYFSIVDVVSILTDQTDYQAARNYWKVLKHRLKKEGNETVTNCNRLKMLTADGKMRLTDVADTEQLLRLIQSVPSPKAEPFKQWLAKVGSERLDQIQDPELSIQQAPSHSPSSPRTIPPSATTCPSVEILTFINRMNRQIN